MPLPTLTLEKISPEQNAQFIIGYLSREKKANTTRPFFEKTISLYPELTHVDDIEDASEREAFFRARYMRLIT